jgi:myo-inositol-1(or 4)-monophosphatase
MARNRLDPEVNARLYFGLRALLPELIPFLRGEYAKTHQLLSANDNTILPDIEAEDRGVDVIRAEFPADSIVAEERSKFRQNIYGRSKYRWNADFIDGSSNFRKHQPYFAINMSIQRGDDIMGGIICDPMDERVYHVRKGNGAYLNGEQLLVSTQRDLSRAEIALISSNSFTKHGEEDLMHRLEQAAGNSRKKGCTSLELAACAAGEIDGVVKPTRNPWQSAGLLMVQEAGGLVTVFDRGSHKIYVASNPYIHTDLCRIVEEK